MLFEFWVFFFFFFLLLPQKGRESILRTEKKKMRVHQASLRQFCVQKSKPLSVLRVHNAKVVGTEVENPKNKQNAEE